MADRYPPLLAELLHELAERLQSAESYLGAAQKIRRDGSEPASVDELFAKAEDHLAQAHATFHRLRQHLSVHVIRLFGDGDL